MASINDREKISRQMNDESLLRSITSELDTSLAVRELNKSMQGIRKLTSEFDTSSLFTPLQESVQSLKGIVDIEQIDKFDFV